MKQILPFILLSACCINALAIPLCNKSVSAVKQQHQVAWQAIIAKQSHTTSAAKNTLSPRPLLANSYIANGTLTDSNRYYYSNGRGSALTDPNSYNDYYYPVSSLPIQTLFTDSSSNWHDIGNGLELTNTKAYTYGIGNIVTDAKYTSPYFYIDYACTYNSNNDLQKVIISDTFGTGTLKPENISYIEYNSQNKRIKDSLVDAVIGNTVARGIYTYDANGNLLTNETYYTITGILTLFYRTTNTYDVSNRLITTITEMDNGGGLKNNTKDSFAYTGSLDKPFYHSSNGWDPTNNTWRFNDRYINHYNTQGFIDNYEYSRYSTQWDTIERDVYTYDADNLILRINGYNYKNGAFETTPYDQTTMYYSVPTTGIKHSITTDNRFALYPNPANTSITITSALQQKGTIAIFNMVGHLMSKRTYTDINKQQIDISRYPAGNYSISIADDKGNPMYNGIFSKL